MSDHEMRCWCWAEQPPRGECVHQAREVVAGTLTEWGLQDLAEDVELVVSELVTNAVVHARTCIVLALTLDGEDLRGEVVDYGPAWMPGVAPSPADVTSERGRGLTIVEALTKEWGVEPLDGPRGKRVWFSCSTDSRAA